jgi:hypothetical protein
MKNGIRINARIISEIAKDMFLTIFSFVSSFIPFLRRARRPRIPSLKRKPPSRGTIGRTLKRETARFNQKIQYNEFTIIQKKDAGRIPSGPAIV